MIDRAMSIKEVAAYVGITEGHLYNMRTRRQGPPYFKVGKKVVYRLKEVELWLQGQRHDPEKDYGNKAG